MVVVYIFINAKPIVIQFTSTFQDHNKKFRDIFPNQTLDNVFATLPMHYLKEIFCRKGQLEPEML